MSMIATEWNLWQKAPSKQVLENKNVSEAMFLNEWNSCVQQRLSEGGGYNPGGFCG